MNLFDFFKKFRALALHLQKKVHKYQLQIITLISFLIYVIIHLFSINKLDYINSDYLSQTKSILNNNWFIINGQFNNRVPPIFPIYLALIQKIGIYFNLPFVLISSFLSILNVILNTFIIRKIFTLYDNKSIIPPFLYLLNPITIYYTFKPMSENPFITCVLLMTFFFLKFFESNKNINLIYSGFFLGLSLLVRPTLLYFTPIFFTITYLVLREKQWSWRFIIVIFSFFIAVSPWIATNIYHNKGIVISSQGNISSLRDGIALDRKDFRSKLTDDIDIRVIIDTCWFNYESFKTNGDIFNYYFKTIKERPIAFIKFQLLKISRVFYGTDTINKKQELFIAMLNIPFLVALIIALYKRKKYDYSDIFLLSLFFYVILISSIVVPLVRYFWPVYFVVLIFIFNPSKNAHE
jgi:4-amino-4-deoxy-L-arabinose transferase-like glycosyltransferase